MRTIGSVCCMRTGIGMCGRNAVSGKELFMHKVKQHKGVAVAAAVCAVAMAASLATHAGAAGDRRY